MNGGFQFMTNFIYLLLACSDKDDPTTNEDDIIEEEIAYETGCFVVNGDQGYASLNDAIKVANDGDEITMSTCSGAHEEKIIIDKSISIIGNGSSVSTFVAPINEDAFEITGSNVTLSGITIDTTRSAISISNSENVVIEDLVVQTGGGWGIQAKNATDLEFLDVNISQMEFGGISLQDSNATITSATLTDNISNAILVDGGVVEIYDASVTGTVPANASAPEDGNAIKTNGNANVAIVGSNFDNNFYAGVFMSSGDVSIENSSIQNSLVASIFTEPNNSNITLINVDIIENLNYGIVHQSEGDLYIENVNISVDSLVSPSTDFEEWSAQGSSLSGTAVYSTSENITLNNVSITGYNNSGLYLISRNNLGNLNGSGVTLDSIGRQGTFIYNYNGTLDTLDVLNSRDVEDARDTLGIDMCDSVSTFAGAIFYESQINIGSGNIVNNEMYGLSAVNSIMQYDNMTVENNYCGGIMNFQTSASLFNSTIVGSNHSFEPLGAGFISYVSDYIEINNSEFTGTDTDLEIIVLLYETSDAFVKNNTFTEGFRQLLVFDSSTTIEDNIFSSPEVSGSAIRLEGLSDSDSLSREHRFSNNIFSSALGNYSRDIYCIFGGSIVMEDDVFSDSGSIYNLDLDSCDTELTNVSFTNTQGTPIYAESGSHEFIGLQLDNVMQDFSNAGAIQILSNSSDSTMNVLISDTEIQNVPDGAGLYFNSNYSSVDYQVTLQNISINNAATGIYAYNTDISGSNITIENTDSYGLKSSNGAVEGQNIDISNCGGNGLILDYGSGFADNWSVDNCDIGYDINNSSVSGDLSASNNLSNGLDAYDSTVDITSSSLQNNNGYGIYVDSESTLNATQTEVSNNTLSGIYIIGGSADFSDITATGNQEYGLQCVDVVSQVCSNMNLAGNTLGEQTFCDSSCGQEAQPEKIDNDGDGYTEEMGDCNDDPDAGGADVYPVDNDGDGFDMCNDCDDNNALTYPGIAINETDSSLCYRDMDMDGFGDNSPSNSAVTPGTDCNDNNILTTPLDADGDGFTGCELLADCNDSNPDIHPYTEDNPVSEICDGIDNDCDGLIDDADNNVDISTYSTFYVDDDGDGYGDSDFGTVSCELPDGAYADNFDDCDDTDSSLTPADNDGDGFSTCDNDCDDSNAQRAEGLDEICDGIDNDCDGLVDTDDNSILTTELGTFYTDADGDGYGDSAATALIKCLIYAPENTATNNEDCNDSIEDPDEDGITIGEMINPAAEENEDSIDNDCDGQIDLDDEDLILESLIFTELHLLPTSVGGGYLELYNTRQGELDLSRYVISNQSESLPLSGTLSSGDYLVVAQSLDSSTNGGLETDVLMDGFSLPDFTSLITVEYDHNETALIVDSLQLESDFISETGSSTQLSSSSTEEDSNDATLWCLSTSSYGDGDLGTPGTINETCQ